MRIALATTFVHRAGGVETYVESVLPALIERGHGVSVWHERALPPGADPIVPAGARSTLLAHTPGDAGFSAMAAWAPDVVFLQGLTDVPTERRLLEIAPTVTFLHAYNGTCISGSKLRRWPSPAPCTRALGPGCLLQYMPRGCGGRSPVTMMRSYIAQRERQALLRDCAAVVTFSDHMRNEALMQGVRAERAVHLPAFVPTASAVAIDTALRRERPHSADGRRMQIAMIGRLEYLKGASLLLDALSRLDAGLMSRLTLTIVGDGRERQRCEEQAAGLRRAGAQVEFAGWLSANAVGDLLARVDLVVMPSIWPEPLGLVGLEAAAAGVAVLAFDVGAVREWLTDGVTGRVLEEPPSADALARGIEDCLGDPERLARWGSAAREQSRGRTLDRHVVRLEQVLERAAGFNYAARATTQHEAARA